MKHAPALLTVFLLTAADYDIGREVALGWIDGKLER